MQDAFSEARTRTGMKNTFPNAALPFTVGELHLHSLHPREDNSDSGDFLFVLGVGSDTL